MPVAATLKEAACPAETDWLAGWVVTEGATALEPTENVAVSVSLPPLESVTDWVIVCVPLATLFVAQGKAPPPLAVPAKS